MLPQPKQPGRTRYLDPMPGLRRTMPVERPSRPEAQEIIQPEAGIAVRAMARMATNRPVSDLRTILELTQRLLERVLFPDGPAAGYRLPITARWLNEPGTELLLEMSQFVPPEQLTLVDLDSRPLDGRMVKLQRQENVLSARFGATPFRHLQEVNLESILSERIFRWGKGLTG